MAYTKDGFHKTTHSGVTGDNSYVLLAGGGHHKFGNDTSYIPISNGTVCKNLNADMLDGTHIGDLLTYFGEGWLISETNTISQYDHKIIVGGITYTAGSSSATIINSHTANGGALSSNVNTMSLSAHTDTVNGISASTTASSASIINSLSISKLTSDSTTNLTVGITINGEVSNDKTLTDLYSKYSKQVTTVKSSTNATYYLTFVNSNNNSANYEEVYTNGDLSFNPSTGVLSLKANQYVDSANTGSLNLNNSDIYGVNSIKFMDACESAGEGIQWFRDSTHVDTIWVKAGVIYFTPNRTWGTNGTSYKVLHTGNTGLYIGGSGNITANSAQSTNGNVYLTLKAEDTYYSHNIKGGTGISVTSDANGHITISNTDTELNTDTKVTQTATTTNANYELLFSGTADNTTRTEGARKTSTLLYNPSTGLLTNQGQVNIKANTDSLLNLYRITSTSGGVFINYYNNNQTSNFWKVGMDSSNNFDFEWIGVHHLLYLCGSTFKVGINTTSPSEKLDVNGDVRIQGNNEYLGTGTGAQCHMQYDNTLKCINFIFD